MKKTNKILLLVLTIIMALSVVVANYTVYAATDDDGYELIDINNDKTEDETPTSEANTASKTNTTGNVITINKTNTANNTATNKTNQATTNHPQTGEFINAKVIAIVSVATIALIFAFTKIKKYNY